MSDQALTWEERYDIATDTALAAWRKILAANDELRRQEWDMTRDSPAS